MSFVEKYISEVQGLYKTEKAREHAYRPAFKILIESLKPDLIAVNDQLVQNTARRILFL